MVTKNTTESGVQEKVERKHEEMKGKVERKHEQIQEKRDEIEMAKMPKDFTMPDNFTSLNPQEMEYDGGWSWTKFASCIVASAVVGYVMAFGTPAIGAYFEGTSMAAAASGVTWRAVATGVASGGASGGATYAFKEGENKLLR